MPRYYFHLRNDLDVTDTEGTELATFELAEAEAYRLVRDMVAAAAVETGRIDLAHSIEVASETGQILLTVPYGKGVRVECNGEAVGA